MFVWVSGPNLNTLCVRHSDTFPISNNYEKIVLYRELKKLIDAGKPD